MLEADTVYQARIRPAMVFGVTQAWLVVELLGPFILFLLSKSFWPFLLIPLLHATGIIGLAVDKRFLEVEMARAICHGPLRRVYNGRNVYLP